MRPSTNAIPISSATHVTMMMGWSKGIAAKVSLPNMSVRSFVSVMSGQTPICGSTVRA